MRERKAARSAWVAVVLLVTPLGLATLPARAGSQDQKKSTYAELVEKAKNGDPGLDFAALRLAFLDARGGHKRGFFNSRELNGLFQQRDQEKLLKTANDFLAQDFVDIRSHFALASAYHALGREEESQKEAALAKGLVKSILDSGDGKTQKTAYVVINTSEEYALTEWLGIHVNHQSLIMANNDSPPCDLLTGTKNGQNVSIYFDISKFYGKEPQLGCC